MSDLSWPDLVRGLQLLCLITWTYPILDKVPSVWRLIANRPERWDAAWMGFWLVAVTQWGFAARWLFWPENQVLWCMLYLSSAMSCIVMVWTQGLRAGPVRNRRALITHAGVLVLCVASTAVLR